MTKTKKTVKAWAALDCMNGKEIVPLPEAAPYHYGPMRVYPTRRAARKESATVVPCTITYELPAKPNARTAPKS